MSSEEFFMYLTIGLIILIPVSVRIYRFLTARQLERALQQEFGKTPDEGRTKNAARGRDHGA